ncbi:hypothetical protein FB550_11763 [Neobacillus bataviensis]|uniref:Uncharacterized protein n=1 Tax=Neobacillus bataviensis TaxID=220685 RepID=A0A561CNA8_9BACI|nr:hypothetical protein FB550_11763 [Neobacillus bataviensis]
MLFLHHCKHCFNALYCGRFLRVEEKEFQKNKESLIESLLITIFFIDLPH